MFDDLLLGMAQRHKGIEDLLYSILSFFERRTDLYHTMEHKEEKMGFPPGVAEQMMIRQFRTLQRRYMSRAQPHLLKDAPEIPPNPRAAPEEPPPMRMADRPAIAADSAEAAAGGAAQSSSCAAATQATGNSKSGGGYPDADAGPGGTSGGDPTLTERFKHISTWNGAVTDRYRWSQSLNELTMEVTVENCKSKDIKVDFGATRVKVMCKGNVIVEGKLHEKINVDDSMWTLEDSVRVVLTMEKVRHTWWKCVFEGDEEIDTTKVESTRRIDEYDGETQGAIRKIMFDQNQKAQGKPTSDQIKTADIMKDAWNAEGSPFAGTEFDPGLLNLQGTVPDTFFENASKQRQEQQKKEIEEKKQAPGGGGSSSGS